MNTKIISFPFHSIENPPHVHENIGTGPVSYGFVQRLSEKELRHRCIFYFTSLRPSGKECLIHPRERIDAAVNPVLNKSEQVYGFWLYFVNIIQHYQMGISPFYNRKKD
ncbi:hypothetical protein B7C51_09500 [Paenibacillus larvae subsp. pulvifaciens]|uniref:Uncharacterized protein n=1 Tax=Paenibacillus larvae subsp. pulvifaciens TaxID=1477 RepID=A0A1V0USK8_9BACL|nr:hypothetical protein B7C51_09500 [Paenibacillus larvae subsp. pulvifaciens]